jgi:DNA-binding transcriptional LysR family regulator
MRNLDPDLLRTLVAFADTGSLGRAATIVGRTPSAVTAQMQRLEDSIGVPLLQAAGRGRTLTEAGEQLVVHARRILKANNEAWLSIAGAAADGRVTLGVTQDFSDIDLPALLNLFARSHPRVRIDLRVGRTSKLIEDLERERIDVVVSMRADARPNELAIIVEPMCWLIARDGLVGAPLEIPLAVLDPPCGFRDAALKAIEGTNRPYRLAASSPSLSGVLAAVRAGIAITARTARWTGPEIIKAPADMHLPNLPKAEFAIRARQGCGEAASRLADVLKQGLAAAAGVSVADGEQT